METISPTAAKSIQDKAAATFAPDDHLLGIVQRAVTARENTRIVLPGKGEILLFPSQGLYYTNSKDFIGFCTTPAADFKVEPYGDAALSYEPGSGKHLKALIWQTAFHASQGRLLEGCSKYDVVQFRHWPNLTRLPITPNAARICALLTRKPSTIMLVHRVLGIEKDEVYQIYSAAHSIGICTRIGNNPESAQAEAELHEKQPQPVKEHGLFRSLFAKISGL